MIAYTGDSAEEECIWKTELWVINIEQKKETNVMKGLGSATSGFVKLIS